MGLGIKLTAGCGHVLDKKCEGLFNFWHEREKKSMNSLNYIT